MAEALAWRRSIRAFLPNHVPRFRLDEILTAAQRAPSWCNVQPWRIWLTAGEATTRLALALSKAAEEGSIECDVDRPPTKYSEPMASLRRQCGRDLYAALDIERGDQEKRRRQWRKNFRAFDAPHILILAVPAELGTYGALDAGVWLQSFMLAAYAAGVGTCAQASLARHAPAVRRVLDIPANLNILCGVAVGYPDTEAPENQRITSREPANSAVTFRSI